MSLHTITTRSRRFCPNTKLELSDNAELAVFANRFGFVALKHESFAGSFSCSLDVSLCFVASGPSFSHFRNGLLTEGLGALPFSKELPFSLFDDLKEAGFRKSSFLVPKKESIKVIDNPYEPITAEHSPEVLLSI